MQCIFSKDDLDLSMGFLLKKKKKKRKKKEKRKQKKGFNYAANWTI